MEIKSFIISTKTIVKTSIIFITLWLAYIIKDVIALVLVSFILALALEPGVEFLIRKKIPRSIAVVIIVILFLSALIALVWTALVPFIGESKNLLVKIPNYVDALVHVPFFESYANQIVSGLGNQVSQLFSNILTVTYNTASTILSSLVIVVFTVYILIDINNIRYGFINFFRKQDRKKVSKTLKAIESKLGAWLRGQLILMFIIGSCTYIGLTALNVDYAIALAVLAGLLEIVPIIGPILSAVPAAIVGFAVSPALGFGVIGLYILIQQLENHLIVPKIMEKAVGQNPLVTILALMIGGQLFNFMGALLAVPVTIIIFEIIKALRSTET